MLATAIKRAEDGTGDVIVRLQNFGGARESVCVSPAGYDSFGAVLAPYEIRTMRHTAAGWVAVNMLEEEEQELAVYDGTVTVEMKPFEIKTVWVY